MFAMNHCFSCRRKIFAGVLYAILLTCNFYQLAKMPRFRVRELRQVPKVVADAAWRTKKLHLMEKVGHWGSNPRGSRYRSCSKTRTARGRRAPRPRWELSSGVYVVKEFDNGSKLDGMRLEPRRHRTCILDRSWIIAGSSCPAT